MPSKVVEYRPIARGFKALGENQELLAAILLKGIENLKGWKTWVSAGTLLGLYRGGKFIPSDTDIDVGVSSEFSFVPDDIIDLMKPWRLHRQLTYNGEVQQLAFPTPEDVVFDVYFYYTKGSFLVTHNDCCVLDKPAWLFNPLVPWHSPVGIIPAPNNLEAYCEMRYGPKWRIPASKKGIYGNDF